MLATEMTLASARDSIRILSWLKANANHARPLIVANKVQTGMAEISKADFEASIERKIDFTVPYDLKAATNAAKLGQVFADANRSSKASGVIRSLAEQIIGSGASDVETEPSKPARASLLGKLDLKAMITKKSKAPATAS